MPAGSYTFPAIERPRDNQAAINFVGELVQYVIFRSIDLLEHSSIEYVKNMERTATVPPEPMAYRSSDVAKAVSGNRFSRVGQEPTLWSAGWIIRVPRGTTISLTREYSAYVVEFKNPSLYVLRFSDSVSSSYTPAANVKAYQLIVKGYFEFKRSSNTDAVQQSEYEKWALELFDGLRRMIRTGEATRSPR
jgi:hypothetical protein